MPVWLRFCSGAGRHRHRTAICSAGAQMLSDLSQGCLSNIVVCARKMLVVATLVAEGSGVPPARALRSWPQPRYHQGACHVDSSITDKRCIGLVESQSLATGVDGCSAGVGKLVSGGDPSCFQSQTCAAGDLSCRGTLRMVYETDNIQQVHSAFRACADEDRSSRCQVHTPRSRAISHRLSA